MKIEIVYEVNDGYAGGARPQHLNLETDDFIDLTPAQVETTLCEILDEDMSRRVSWSVRGYDVLLATLRKIAAGEPL